MNDERRLAVARRVVEAQKCFRVFTNYDTGECWVKPATLQAMREAEQAFANDEYDQAEHLSDVVLVMMHRDISQYRADPKAWIVRVREQDHEATP
jgi:hypothetical protein